MAQGMTIDSVTPLIGQFQGAVETEAIGADGLNFERGLRAPVLDPQDADPRDESLQISERDCSRGPTVTHSRCTAQSGRGMSSDVDGDGIDRRRAHLQPVEVEELAVMFDHTAA